MEKKSREALYARKLGKEAPFTFEVVREVVETRDSDVVANLAICIIHQTNYLLDRQLVGLEREFIRNGGLRERMTRARFDARSTQCPNQKRGTTT